MAIDQQLEDLLKRVQEGIASPEDYQLLRTFINNDTSGEVIARVHAFHAANGKDALAADAYDPAYWGTMVHTILQTDKAGIQNANEPDVNGAPVRRLYGSRRWDWVAAAILVLLAGGAYLFNRQTPTASTPAVTVAQKTEEVMPGKYGALLTLSDGKPIVLDSAQNGVIAVQGNTDVQLQNGRLAYNKKNEQASSENVVTYNTLQTPRGSHYQVVLPDGTKVWLNAASSIRFPTQFTQAVREVEITGETYLEVAKNAAKPFRVKVNKATVEVLGTHFNINAYDDEESMKTTLLEGKVKVVNGQWSMVNKKPGKYQEAILKPGEQVSISHSSQLSHPISVQTDEVMAWKNGLFQFENADIRSVMRQLSRWYDVDVSYKSQPDPNITFSGKLGRDLRLTQALKILQKSDVHFEVKDKKIIVIP